MGGPLWSGETLGSFRPPLFGHLRVAKPPLCAMMVANHPYSSQNLKWPTMGGFSHPPTFFFFLFLDFFSKKKIIFKFLKIYKYGIFVNSSSKNPCVTHLHHFLSKKTKIDNGWANLPTVEISKELITTF